MKKIILTMMACAGLCACTNEEVVGPSGTTAADELGGEVAYITVNIKDVGSSTRAGDGGFAYGTADEQKVANAYFYFYDDNGNYMARGSVASVSGESNGTEGTSSTGIIDWSSNTVVAVYGLTYETLPTRMVTVLNQPDGFSGTHLSLSEMQAALAQATDGYKGANDYFVMSTSSYYDPSSYAIVNYTALTPEDFRLEPIDLETDYPDPDGSVAVYVERLAAKVGVSAFEGGSMTDGDGNTLDYLTVDGYTYYDITRLVSSEFADDLASTNSIGVTILGWDINGTSRDSYMLKNIDFASNWASSPGFNGWNDAPNYRCYWAESPNYGKTDEYPTSSNGNTDAYENTAGLDTYLKYTSLSDPIKLGSYGYCAENTNTTTVLKDASSTGITNVLVKAQAAIIDKNYGSASPVDLVKFHGEYYTVKDFCNQTVSDVVTYDLNTIVKEVIEALEESHPALSEYIEELNDAIYKDAVWCYNNTTNELSQFDGSMLSLYNVKDGNVTIYFKTTQPQWGDGTEDHPFTNVDPTMAAKYPDEDIVYEGNDLDKYGFYFHVDNNKLSSATNLGLVLAGLLKTIDGDSYLFLSNDITISTSSEFTTEKGHLYTLRNYFLRAITVQADAIDGYFGTFYPTYYKNGMMYYSIPIEHLGVEGINGIAEGQYGVVRNHWYNITINYISDLGHGIADEDEVIVPQKEDVFYYLGATVNILSWKMIEQSAGLK